MEPTAVRLDVESKMDNNRSYDEPDEMKNEEVERAQTSHALGEVRQGESDQDAQPDTSDESSTRKKATARGPTERPIPRCPEGIDLEKWIAMSTRARRRSRKRQKRLSNERKAALASQLES